MWIVRWIVGTILVLLIIGFAIQNTDVEVVVKFYKWQSVALPLWVIMYLSFAGGVLTWLVVSIFRIVLLKRETRKVKRENKRLREELNRLRNVAIEEEAVAGEAELSELPMKDVEKPLGDIEEDTEEAL